MGKKRQINKTIVYPVAFFLLVAVSLVYKYILNDRASGMVIKKEEEVTSEVITESSQTVIETEPRTCQIYICGAVNKITMCLSLLQGLCYFWIFIIYQGWASC